MAVVSYSHWFIG